MKIYVVKVKQEFAAAHWLKDYPGNCSQIHGHTWEAEVTLSGSNLDHMGMLVDFRAVRAALRDIIGRYDHRLLNELEPFDMLNPTAENLARIIYEQMQAVFTDLRVVAVEVWEGAAASASYRGDDI